MDKEQIINIIKSNPNLSFDEMKKQALESGMTAELFEVAWNETRGAVSESTIGTASTKIDLQKKSIGGVIVLTMITLGIYIPIWLFKQKDGLNNLNSKMKIGNTIIIITLLLQIAYILSITLPSFFITTEDMLKMIGGLSDYSIWVKLQTYSFYIGLFAGIAILKVVFDIRSMINSHFNTKLSWAGTFFFNIFYLQYKINHLVISE